MPYAMANGVRLAYVESGQGEPLLLLHGGNSDRRQYDVFRPLLGDGIRAIAPDQRDSPDSPCDPADYAITDHADDAAALIAALGLEKAHVMGASYGGTVAMTLALLHPERVKSLILGATLPAFSQFAVPDLAEIRKDGPQAVARFMLSTVVSPDAIDNDPDLIADTEAALVIRDQESLGRRMEAIRQHDVRAQLGEISAPTLVLCGDSDPLIGLDDARAMAMSIPKARFQALEGSRHGITFQHRQRTADLVRQFVLAHA